MIQNCYKKKILLFTFFSEFLKTLLDKHNIGMSSQLPFMSIHSLIIYWLPLSNNLISWSLKIWDVALFPKVFLLIHFIVIIIFIAGCGVEQPIVDENLLFLVSFLNYLTCFIVFVDKEFGLGWMASNVAGFGIKLVY